MGKISRSLTALLLASASGAFAQGEEATAELRNATGEQVGSAVLQQTEHGVLITVSLSNLPAGVHAFHIHETGRCEPPFASAGGHFNPAGSEHGFRVARGVHAGDLPNIHIPRTGRVTVEALASGVTLERGAPNSLVDGDGSALVIHAGADDYRSQPAGDAGERIACGVITRARTSGY